MDGTSSVIGTSRLGDETTQTLSTFQELYDRLSLEDEEPLWVRAIEPVVDANAASTPLGKSKLKLKTDKLTKERDGIQEIREPLSELIAKDADAETVLKTLKAIPHPLLRRIIDGIDLTKDSAQTAIKTVESTLTTIEETLNTQIKFFGRLDKALKLAGYVIEIRAELRTALDKEIEVWGAVETQILPELDALTVPPGTGTVLDLQPALTVFADRIESRRGLAEDAIGFLDGVEDAISAATQGTEDVAITLVNALNTGLDAVDTVLDTLAAIKIPDLSGVLTPINGALGVLDAVGKVIKPVIDFFGPVVSLINLAFEKVASALGLDTLQERIRAAVEDAINAIVDPILDEMRAVIDDLIAAIQEPFEQLQETYENLARGLTDVLVDRPASAVGVDDEDGTEALFSGTGAALAFIGVTDNAILAGSDGAETIQLVAARNADDGWSGLAIAGGGGDSVDGTEGRDLIFAGDGEDTVNGAEGDDQIVGGAGADSLSGGAGKDEIDGGADDDTLLGGTEDDVLLGGGGADSLLGGDGNDRLIGGTEADVLQGGTGDDTVEGGTGADTIISTAGDNLLTGNEGLDLIVTVGEASARHRITDASAELRGGAGTDELVLGDAFATGTTHEDEVTFDAGSGRDVVEAGDLDLTAFADRFTGFETLRIARSSETATLRTDVEALRGFDGLELSGDGPLRIEVTGQSFDMNALYGGERPFLFDVSDVAREQNPHDGSKAGNDGFATSTVYDLTLARVDAGLLRALNNQGAGFRMEGSDGADHLIGGSGSDILRGGLGADTLDGGRSDDGDRFDLEGASGDVYIGTPEELDGDIIRNLSNRVDSVRIEIDVEDEDDYSFASEAEDGFEVVTFTAGDTTTTFRLEGSFPKLRSAIGDYVNEAGDTVRYVEIFNNNIPPTARGESFETAFSQDGVSFDPFLNDFDVDTVADPENGIAFRQIALPESIADLFRVVETVDEDDKREAFNTGQLIVTPGDELVTDQGNLIRVASFGENAETGETEYELVYIAREQTVALRPFEYTPPEGDEELGIGDEIAVRYSSSIGGRFDPTEDLPFFGQDRLTYQVFDTEGELSREVSINFLVRPDVLGADGEVTGTPTVTVQEIQDGETVNTFDVSLNPITDSDEGTGRDAFERISSRSSFITVAESNADLASALAGNDLFRIADLEALGPSETILGQTYWGHEGNDVLDGRGVAEDLRLFGGIGADWVEGGDGDDTLLAGGLDDELIDPSMRVQLTDDNGDPLPFTARPDEQAGVDILLGGAGNNVLATNGTGLAPGISDNYMRTRDVFFVLDEDGADIVTGPMSYATATNGEVYVQPDSAMGATTTTLMGLQDDTIQGFDSNDKIVIPLNLQRLREREDDTDTIIASGENTYSLTASYDLAAVDLTMFEGDDFGQISSDLGLGTAEGSRVLFSYGLAGRLGTAFLTAENALTYDIQTRANDFREDASVTVVDLSLDLYEANYINGSLSNPSTTTGFPGQAATAGIAFRQVDEVWDPTRAFGSQSTGLDISFEMVGAYDSSKFRMEVVKLPNALSVSDTLEVGTEVETTGGAYTTIASADWADSNDFLALEITYFDTEPEAVDDDILVVRDRPAIVDVLANDIDEDGDTLKIWEVMFDSEEDAVRLQDGDLSNGELIQETDPNDGLGTGIFTVVAADSAEDEITRFGYVATDGTTLTDTAWVDVTEVAPPPILSDDLLVLPATEVFEELRIPVTQLMANDVAPDGDPLDPATFQMTPIGASAAIVGGEPVVWLDGTDLVLAANTVEGMAVNPAFTSTGRSNVEVTIEYTLAGSIPGLRSDPALAVISTASALQFYELEPLAVEEDGSVSVDLIAQRFGGFGAVSFEIGEILSEGAPAPEAGVATVTETGFSFAPAENSNGTPLTVSVIATDETGQQGLATVAIEVLPTPDDPELRATLDGPVLTAVSATEDVVAEGTLFAVDPDLGEIASLIAPDPIETEEGGLLTFTETDMPGRYDWRYDPSEDFAGTDSALLTLSSAGLAVQVTLDVEVAAVNDAPRLPGDAEIGIDVAGEARILLLDGAEDVDGQIDPDSLTVSAQGDASAISWSVAEEEGGPVLIVTGATSGTAQLSYTLADETGAKSVARVLDFNVNAPPVTVTDTYTAVSRDPIVIDAIANDSDLEGTIDYVREDGVPIFIDPRDSFGFTLDDDGEPVPLSDAPGLQGSVEWDAEQQAFVYTPPGGAAFGATDVFFYEVVDEAGAVTRESVLVDLLRPGERTLRLTDTDDITVTEAPETIVAGEAGARLEGTLAQFDGDEILAFRSGSEILLTDVPRGSTGFDVARLFDTGGLAPLDVAGLSAAPTLAGLFGGADLDALTAAFVGETVVGITGPSGTSTLTFSGSVVGGVRLQGEEGGTLISYRDSSGPTGRGDDLRGGAGGDEIDGLGGNDLIDGAGGPDSLIGGEGRDVLIGGDGENVLTGGAGPDLFVLAGGGTATITDFDPSEGDRIAISDGRYLTGEQQVDPDLVALVADGDGWRLEGTLEGEETEVLARFDIADSVIRGDGAVNGTSGADVIDTGSGRDQVRALGGDDLVTTNAGNDRLEGGAGDDTLIGGEGNDQLIADGGDDVLTGEEGADVFAFLRGDTARVVVTDFSAGDVIALDDRFFGLGDAGLDPRAVTSGQVVAALRSERAVFDRDSGELEIDPDGSGGAAPILTIELGAGQRLDAETILLF